jgi:hypothetical protein
MPTKGIITIIKNSELKSALDATPDAIEPALSIINHVTIANFVTFIIL